MDTIKLVAPEGVTSASFEGQQYDVAEDGTVTVPAEAALQLYGFGFGNAPASEPSKAEKVAAAAAQVKAAKAAVAAAEGDEAKAAVQAALADAEAALKTAKA